MRVVCIKNCESCTLTIDKIYDVIINYGTVMSIIDDFGTLRMVSKNIFMSIEEYRDLKLENILK